MPEYGEVVCAVAGRDKPGLFAVVGTDGNRVWIADGKRRTLRHPKAKNPRHLRTTGQILAPTEMATNRELRRALQKRQDTIT